MKKHINNTKLIQMLMKKNDGYITTKELTEIGIHRMYLSAMLEKGIIEKLANGIYIDKNTIEDVYYTFQLKYSKTIFSGMTALYFHGLTEVYPNKFDVTIDNNYHVETINKNHNVIKCRKETINIGVTNVKTPMEHNVRAYDPERCICDIIKYRKKLDFEQVKKSVKMYLKSKYRNLDKLAEYSKKLNVYDEVMGFVGMYYE